jgi:predicted nicotinamide N-methyase
VQLYSLFGASVCNPKHSFIFCLFVGVYWIRSIMVDDDSDRDVIDVLIGDKSYFISLAEEEFNKEKKTLFATHLWPAATQLSLYLIDNPHLINDRKIIEFGAGAALPSLVSTNLHPRVVCVTDYPVACILDNIQANFSRNFNGEIPVNVKIQGYMWGTDLSPLLTTRDEGSEVNFDQYFDIAIACECIWKPDCHKILLQSISQALRPNGVAYIAYSIHIQSLEHAYLNFFKLAESFGLHTVDTVTTEGKHMWSDKIVPIFIAVLKKS